jgi:hypothetical protein
VEGEAGLDPAVLALILVGFPIVFGGFWLGITTLLAHLSGWATLQSLYADRPEPALVRLKRQSASMGGLPLMPVNFNRCLTLEACAFGLRFRLWRMFGFFQQPFFVPWTDIKAEPGTMLIFKAARLRVARWPDGKVMMSRRCWNRLVESVKPALTLPTG